MEVRMSPVFFGIVVVIGSLVTVFTLFEMPLAVTVIAMLIAVYHLISQKFS